MASMISKIQPSDSGDVSDNNSINRVSSQLYLKTSPAAHAYQNSDKKLVLRRIRRHRSMIKVRSAFQSLLGLDSSTSGENGLMADGVLLSNERKWLELEQGYAFSSA